MSGCFLKVVIILFFILTKVHAGEGTKNFNSSQKDISSSEKFPVELWIQVFHYLHLVDMIRMSQVNSFLYRLSLSYFMQQDELKLIYKEGSKDFEYYEYQQLKKILILWFDWMSISSFSVNLEQMKKVKEEVNSFQFKQDSFAFFVKKAALSFIEKKDDSSIILEHWSSDSQEMDMSPAAMDILIICHQYGLGVPKNEEIATRFEKKITQAYQESGKFPFYFTKKIGSFLKIKIEDLMENLKIDALQELCVPELLCFIQYCFCLNSMNLIRFVKESIHLDKEHIENLLEESSNFYFFEKLKMIGLYLEFSDGVWLERKLPERLKKKFDDEPRGPALSLKGKLRNIQYYLYLKRNLGLSIEIIEKELNSEAFYKEFTSIFNDPQNRFDICKVQIIYLYLELKKDLEVCFDKNLFLEFFKIDSHIPEWLKSQQRLMIENLEKGNRDVIPYCFKSEIQELKNGAQKWMKNFLEGSADFLEKLCVAKNWVTFYEGKEILNIWYHLPETQKQFKEFFVIDENLKSDKRNFERQYQGISFCIQLGCAEPVIEWFEEFEKIFVSSDHHVSDFFDCSKIMQDCLCLGSNSDVLVQYGKAWWKSEKTYIYLNKILHQDEALSELDIYQLAFLYSKIL